MHWLAKSLFATDRDGQKKGCIEREKAGGARGLRQKGGFQGTVETRAMLVCINEEQEEGEIFALFRVGWRRLVVDDGEVSGDELCRCG